MFNTEHLLKHDSVAFLKAGDYFSERAVGDAHLDGNLACTVLLRAIGNQNRCVLLRVILDGIFRDSEYAFVLVENNLRMKGIRRITCSVGASCL